MRKSIIATLVLTLCLAAPLNAASTTAPSQTDFLRLVDRGTTGSKLETADVAYRNADGVTVHLIAAVHVGEREYFEGLNQNFKLHDVVLYEMVKPRDRVMPAPGAMERGEKVESTSPVSEVQRMMKDMLGLEFQLDVVDYGASNFVHADMDAETFQKMQDERGESFTSMFLQAFVKQMMTPPPAEENAADAKAKQDDLDQQLEDLVKLITRPDMERRLKMTLAHQLVDMESNPFGPDAMNGTVLLTERNKTAMAAFDRALASGKKDIAIFYGAAHMPDLSKQLAERGFKPIATEWRMAWDLTIRPDAPSAMEKLLMEAVKSMKDGD